MTVGFQCTNHQQLMGGKLIYGVTRKIMHRLSGLTISDDPLCCRSIQLEE